MESRSFRVRSCSAAVLSALLCAGSLAGAQVPPTDAAAQPSRPDAGAGGLRTRDPVRAQFVNYDSGRGVLTYLEASSTVLAQFYEYNLVAIANNVAPQRTRLNTDEDLTRARQAAQSGNNDPRPDLEQRVQRAIDAARASGVQGTLMPVSEVGSMPSGCRRAPYAPREFSAGDQLHLRLEVSPDGARTNLTLTQGGRAGETIQIPAVALSTMQGMSFLPYDRVADVRVLPGTDRVGVLLASDACTPPNAIAPAVAVLAPPPPPPERPLTPLANAALPEATVMRALAPGARRRTVDGTEGYFEGRTHVVFDGSWDLPNSNGELFMVQFTRRDPAMSPLLAEGGQSLTRFALMRRHAGRITVVSQYVPPPTDNVFEGTGQEAFSVDLDGDAFAEVVVRTRVPADHSEYITVLRWNEQELMYMYHTTVARDDRAAGTAAGMARPEQRRCTLGSDGRTLVVRCQVQFYSPNAAPNATPTQVSTAIERVQCTSGSVQVQRETQ